MNTVVNSNNETHYTSLFRGRALVGVVRVSLVIVVGKYSLA